MMMSMMMRRVLLPLFPVVVLLFFGSSSSVAQQDSQQGGDNDHDHDDATAARDRLIDSAVRLARETIDRRANPPPMTTTIVDAEVIDGEKSSSPSPTSDQPSLSDDDDDANLTYDGLELIDWINDNGGFVHPNARIGLDPSGRYRGVFVKGVNGEEGGTADGIEDGDIVARIPWDLIVKPKNYSEKVYWSCEALQEMHRQFLLGDESPHAPYIKYLKNQPRGRLPNEWTPDGKDLLGRIVLGHRTPFDDERGDGLPPKTNRKDFEEAWIGECGGEDTELARAAFYQFTSRDEDTLMVPFYDMHNHSNDLKKLNTISTKPSGKGKPFVLRSTRDIPPGEQILISYNRCHPCWSDRSYRDCVSYSHYGTTEVFDLFGFVEFLPQFWRFEMDIGRKYGRRQWDKLTVCLEASDHGDGGNSDYPLKVTFGDNYAEDRDDERPILENIEYLGGHLLRLADLESSIKEDEELMQTIPKYEWDMTWTYHEALMTAISASILASDFADGPDSEDEAESGDSGDSRDSDDSWDDSDDDSSDDGGRDEL